MRFRTRRFRARRRGVRFRARRFRARRCGAGLRGSSPVLNLTITRVKRPTASGVPLRQASHCVKRHSVTSRLTSKTVSQHY